MSAHTPALMIAFELGFRAAERGENPQAALAKFVEQIEPPKEAAIARATLQDGGGE